MKCEWRVGMKTYFKCVACVLTSRTRMDKRHTQERISTKRYVFMKIDGRKTNTMHAAACSGESRNEHQGTGCARRDVVAAKRFHLLAYNVFCRPIGISNDIRNGDYKDERLDAISANLSPYDVVGMQELFDTPCGRRDRFLRRVSKQSGLRHHCVSPAVSVLTSGFLFDGGVAILSKHRICKTSYLPFDDGVLADGYAQKGILYALLAIEHNHTIGGVHHVSTANDATTVPQRDECGGGGGGGGDSGVASRAAHHYVHVFCVHLQSSRGLRSDKRNAVQKERYERSVEVRNDQLSVLSQFVEDTTRANAIDGVQWPAFVIGDFNVNSRSMATDCKAVAPFTEYCTMMNLLNRQCARVRFEDTWAYSYAHPSQYPITFGDVVIDCNEKTRGASKCVARDKVLTRKTERCSQQCLDYVMLVRASAASCEQAARGSDAHVRIGDVHACTVPFFCTVRYTDGTRLPFEQLSDHYGVHATVDMEFLK